MNLKEKLTELQALQQKLGSEYQSLITEYQSTDLIIENEKLRREMEDHRQELAKLEADIQATLRENDRLRLTLQEQILDEKLNILKISRAKLETYFTDQKSEYKNQLTELETKIKARLAKLKEAAGQNLIPLENHFHLRLSQLETDLELAIREQLEQFNQTQQQLREELHSRMDSMARAEITPELMAKRAKQNQWEMKLGLNWINRIGVLLILFGVGAVFNYSYNTWMNNYLKGICFFVLSGLFMLGGEWFYRKRKTVFSMGLLGGGIAILYSSIFYSYFGLKIISFDVSMLLSILTALTTIVLSIRYNSPTIGTLGLVGGYLPFLSLIVFFGGITGSNFIAAMSYLLILNLLIILISFWKKWIIVNYFSFLMNIPAMIYLVFNIPDIWVGIGYAEITFLMYLGVTLVYPVKTQTAVKLPETVLLGLNTLVNCLIMFLLLEKAGLGEFRGMTALMFCLIYIGLGCFIQKTIRNEKNTMIVFYGTALTFAVLTIPLQFGISWLSMGWLVEGVFLAVLGFRSRQKSIEFTGWSIFGLCFMSFVMLDFLPRFVGAQVKYFELKYLLLTLGEVLLLSVYALEIAKNNISMISNRGKVITGFKYFTVFSIWIYLLYTGSTLYRHWMPQFNNYGFYHWILMAVITIGLGYLITHIKLLYDKVIRGFSIFLYILSDLLCIILSMGLPVLQPESGNPILNCFTLLILLIYNTFVFINIRSLILQWIHGRKISLEFYPVLLGLYLLGSITGFLIVQFHFGAVNLLFSFIYLGIAIGFIIYGFMRRFIYIRRLGLGLTLFAIAKLFIYDLSSLNSAGKIIAYFGFGIVLLVVSFIYQKVKNSVEDYHDVKSRNV